MSQFKLVCLRCNCFSTNLPIMLKKNFFTLCNEQKMCVQFFRFNCYGGKMSIVHSTVVTNMASRCTSRCDCERRERKKRCIRMNKMLISSEPPLVLGPTDSLQSAILCLSRPFTRNYSQLKLHNTQAHCAWNPCIWHWWKWPHSEGYLTEVCLLHLMFFVVVSFAVLWWVVLPYTKC